MATKETDKEFIDVLNGELIGKKSRYYNTIKYNQTAIDGKKRYIVGYYLIRLYYDSKTKDCLIGEEKIELHSLKTPLLIA